MNQSIIYTAKRYSPINKDYIEYIIPQLFRSDSVYNIHDKTYRVVMILLNSGVTEEEILDMSYEEGLTYIYLLL